jgi:hypothetical protein
MGLANKAGNLVGNVAEVTVREGRRLRRGGRSGLNRARKARAAHGPTVKRKAAEARDRARRAAGATRTAASTRFTAMKEPFQGEGGMSSLFGLGQVKAAPGRFGKARENIMSAHGPSSSLLAISGQKEVGPGGRAAGQAWGEAKMMARSAWNWGSAAELGAKANGPGGWARAGAVGARGAMVYGGMAAADFVNPFGFGWND